MDNMQILQQVIERYNEHEISLCLAFIDFEKAFDHIKLSTILKALQRHDIEEPYESLLESIYTNARATLYLVAKKNKSQWRLPQSSTLRRRHYYILLECGKLPNSNKRTE